MAAPLEYRTTVVEEGGRVLVPVPVDPDEVWGPKPRHHVGGTVDGMRVRGVVERAGPGWAFTLGAAAGLRPGPRRHRRRAARGRGPQRDELAPDVAAALDADPEAGAAFDGLAQFYRKGFLRWVDGTKRRPDLRAARIAEMVELLRTGHKERPKG